MPCISTRTRMESHHDRSAIPGFRPLLQRAIRDVGRPRAHSRPRGGRAPRRLRGLDGAGGRQRPAVRPPPPRARRRRPAHRGRLGRLAQRTRARCARAHRAALRAADRLHPRRRRHGEPRAGGGGERRRDLRRHRPRRELQPEPHPALSRADLRGGRASGDRPQQGRSLRGCGVDAARGRAARAGRARARGERAGGGGSRGDPRGHRPRRDRGLPRLLGRRQIHADQRARRDREHEHRRGARGRRQGPPHHDASTARAPAGRRARPRHAGDARAAAARRGRPRRGLPHGRRAGRDLPLRRLRPRRRAGLCGAGGGRVRRAG